VLDNDQRIEIDGTANYKVKRPNRFVIEVTTPRIAREFYYDGRSLTIYEPRVNLFTTVPAPSTIRDVFQMAADKYNIEVPLEDLFHWGLPEEKHNFTSAGVVGYSKIGGVDADQYAFREGDIDWQIWIERGSSPLPVKLVIDKRSDVAVPQYTAVLHWNTNICDCTSMISWTIPRSLARFSIRERNSWTLFSLRTTAASTKAGISASRSLGA